MNRSCLLLAAAGLLLATPAFAQSGGKTLSAYEQAVKSYVDAAEAELRAFREQIESEVKDKPDDGVARYIPAIEQLEKTEAAFESLLNARQNQFDPRKLAYEKARDALVGALTEARAAK